MEILVRKATEGEKKYMSRCAIWESDITEFDYYYDHDETCLILEGQAVIDYKNGGAVKINPGDIAYFPKGLECRWNVLAPIRKNER